MSTSTNVGMQRFVDLLDDERRDRVEARGAADLLCDALEQPLRIVALPEKPAVEALQPSLAARTRAISAAPTSVYHHHRDCSPVSIGSLPMQQDVGQQQRTEHGDQGGEQPSRQRVAHALPDDETEVEQPVAQDGVGERGRHGEKHQREHRERAGGEDVHAGVVPVARDRAAPAGTPMTVPTRAR